MGNYPNAFVEVDTILGYLNEEEYNKIPTEMIEVIRENKSEDYIFDYDEELELKEQILLPETRAILFNIFRDYLASDEQREKIQKMQREDRFRDEQRKAEEFNKKYNSKEIDDAKQQEEKIEQPFDEEINSNKDLVEYNESFFKKIINKLKRILK